jgi:hypothetical protein
MCGQSLDMRDMRLTGVTGGLTCGHVVCVSETCGFRDERQIDMHERQVDMHDMQCTCEGAITASMTWALHVFGC